MQYTGHFLVDIGAAAIAAHAHKPLGSVTESDLDEVVDYMIANYVENPLKSFLNVAFPNSGYANPAFEKTPVKRTEYAERMLRGYRHGAPVLANTKCVFTGEPATANLTAGRAFRQHVPMLTGEGIVNFHPWGDAGLPISGIALLCIQAFPLGCAKCGGKLLGVHSDNIDIMEGFAAQFLRHNQASILIARQSGSTKMPEAGSSAKTLLVETFLNIQMQRNEAGAEGRPCSVTAYHLSNSGQSNPLDSGNPPLDIYYLPLQLTGFLSSIVSPDHKTEWDAIAGRAWRLEHPPKKRPKEGDSAGDTRPRRNFLYEDLLGLPENARGFVRHYLLRTPKRTAFPDDPRRTYSLGDEASLVSWKLTALFLERVMRMDKERIKEISELGDRLAAYVNAENDRRFFSTFYGEQRSYGVFRNALIKANVAHVKRGNKPLISLDPYITVFEEGDDVARSDWRLARDLVLIRMIEKLYDLGWIGNNKDAIPERQDETEPSAK